MSNTGRRLRESNEEILKYIQQLRDQRNELCFLVEKQKLEKANLEADMARISYKFGLINKSMSQRERALKLYDATIMEVEAKYKGLADSTQGLLTHVRNESSNLENSIDKRIGTEKECADCPRCDITTQNRNEMPQNQNTPLPQHQNTLLQNRRKSQGHFNEIPTKQKSENEKRKLESRGPSYSEIHSHVISNNPIYNRAMEYPMVLSPMIDKEHIEHMKERITGSNVNSLQAIPRTTLNNDSIRVLNGSASVTPAKLSIVDYPQNQIDFEKGILSKSSSGSGNFMDGDYSEMHPSRDTSEKSSPTVNEESISKDVTPQESSAPSSIDYTQTTSTDGEEKGKPAIDEYDEVIEDAESGARNKKSTVSGAAKYSSSVDVFGQAYKNQHELRDNPPSLARYKKSIFNKRNQSLFTEENS